MRGRKLAAGIGIALTVCAAVGIGGCGGGSGSAGKPVESAVSRSAEETNQPVEPAESRSAEETEQPGESAVSTASRSAGETEQPGESAVSTASRSASETDQPGESAVSAASRNAGEIDQPAESAKSAAPKRAGETSQPGESADSTPPKRANETSEPSAHAPYIKDSVFHCDEFGLAIDLSDGEREGCLYEATGETDGRACLLCRDAAGKERYSVYMEDMGPEFYVVCDELEDAASFGAWLMEQYQALGTGGAKGETGIELKETKDLLLDGRKAFKLVIHTSPGIKTIESTMVWYVIPDEEQRRMLRLSRQFLFEGEEDIRAFEACVESLTWTAAR